MIYLSVAVQSIGLGIASQADMFSRLSYFIVSFILVCASFSYGARVGQNFIAPAQVPLNKNTICVEVLQTSDLPEPIVINENKIVFGDTDNNEFYIYANVQGGMLKTEWRLRNERGGRSSQLKGAREFPRIIEYFSGRFTAIEGEWRWGDNLRVLNELTGPPNNMPIIEAAKRTFTGRHAVAAGFTDVRISPYYLYTYKPGEFLEFQVRFYKPQVLVSVPGFGIDTDKYKFKATSNANGEYLEATLDADKSLSIQTNLSGEVALLQIENALKHFFGRAFYVRFIIHDAATVMYEPLFKLMSLYGYIRDNFTPTGVQMLPPQFSQVDWRFRYQYWRQNSDFDNEVSE